MTHVLRPSDRPERNFGEAPQPGTVISPVSTLLVPHQIRPLLKAVVAPNENVKKAQDALQDKGYDPGPSDGALGPRTKAALRQFQQSVSLPVTGRLDVDTASKLGVEPESVGGNLKGAGTEVKEGGQEAGHEIKEGKPVATGKELGKGVGRAGKKVGKAVKEAVDPDSDHKHGEAEKKEEGEK